MEEIKLEVGKYYKSKDNRRIIKVVDFDKDIYFQFGTIDYIINHKKIERNRWIPEPTAFVEISEEEAAPYFI